MHGFLRIMDEAKTKKKFSSETDILLSVIQFNILATNNFDAQWLTNQYNLVSTKQCQ